jgi:predicted nuclease of restriction endonuclease-like (RecB) superfamily
MAPQLLTSPPEGYIEWLREIKERIQSARQKAVLAANSEMIVLYWQIGRDILERQGIQGWGAKVVDRLADDLRREFPEMKGFSSRNLKYMRLFAETWTDGPFVQRVVAQIPWGHNITFTLRQWIVY